MLNIIWIMKWFFFSWFAQNLDITVAEEGVSMWKEKHEEYPEWSLSDMEKMNIDPMQLAN